jgi:UDP:flavonoid glycosyltransferase YjiC (YdhE family)
VLFIAEAVTLAHVARTSVLAGSLDPAQYDVHAAWDPRYNALFGDLPFTFHPIRTIATEAFLRRVAHGVPLHDAKGLHDNVKEDLATIEKVRPAVVVGDFRVSLAVSARVARVPLVTIANAYWSPYARQTFLFREYDYPLTGVLGRNLARSLFRIFRPLGFAAHTRPLNTVLKAHRLPSIGGDIRVMYTFGDYTAYCDIPELVPTFDRPPNHHYLGAVLWSPRVPHPPWWNDLPSDRPIVYVTPGSSGDGNFLPIVLAGLADQPVTVVAATARRGGAPDCPRNARVADFLPGTEAAARSSVVICNGGSPTTSQALAAGRPVLGIVSNNMDQHLNMEAVRRTGAGEVLRARDLDPRAVRDAVSKMLSGAEYASAAGALARAHRACNAQARFRAMVEEIVAGSDCGGDALGP